MSEQIAPTNSFYHVMLWYMLWPCICLPVIGQCSGQNRWMYHQETNAAQ